jgi:AraC family transcriptional regulator
MIPGIRKSSEKKLIGKRLNMSFDDYRVSELWRSFMPRRKEIINTLSSDLISMSVYRPKFFEEYDPSGEFEKWAAVEVSDFDNVPEGMETYILNPGLYSVFDYKGSNMDHSIFEYIFRSWLPNSDYMLDNRPHFEVLDDKYKNNDPSSEEEIWIPVKPK